MAGEPIGGEAAAGWSRRNVADVGIALFGFGVVVSAVGLLMNLVLQVVRALLPGFGQNVDKPMLLMWCGSAFLQLFLGLWLIAHHDKISSRLFRAAPGAPVAERRAGLAFGIKVYALYLAAFAATLPVSGIISKALWFLPLSMLLSQLPKIAVCLYFLKRPGWLVSFAYPEGEPDEDA